MPFMILFTPRIPAGLIAPFLEGVGCIDVAVVAGNSTEGWLQFRFLGRRFEVHRDGEAWHFFADNGCTSELLAVLSDNLQTAKNPLWAWVAVAKGMAFGQGRYGAAAWSDSGAGAAMTDEEGVALIEAAAVSHDPVFVEHVLQCTGEPVASQVPALIALLKSPHHHCHEEIVMSLQRLKDPRPAEALFDAALIQHEYLDYDDNFGLARKCTWALADIGSPEARNYLEQLAANQNPVIAGYARKRLDCWGEEAPRKGWPLQP